MGTLDRDQGCLSSYCKICANRDAADPQNKFMGLSNKVLTDWRQRCRSFAATWWSPDLAASPPEGWTLLTLARELIPGPGLDLQSSVFIGNSKQPMNDLPSSQTAMHGLAIRLTIHASSICTGTCRGCERRCAGAVTPPIGQSREHPLEPAKPTRAFNQKIRRKHRFCNP
jgi:hypothetical protein